MNGNTVWNDKTERRRMDKIAVFFPIFKLLLNDRLLEMIFIHEHEPDQKNSSDQQLSERLHTEKSFRFLIKSTRNQILFTIFLLIRNQMYVRLDPNQSENGKYNLISVWFNKISKGFLGV